MPNVPPIPPNPRRIAFLASPDVQLLDVTGPLQVFASTNRLVEEAGASPAYALTVVSAVPGPIVSSAGLAVVAEQHTAATGALARVLAQTSRAMTMRCELR
jgi:transcriptional regulator GlxA family with amidase domain